MTSQYFGKAAGGLPRRGANHSRTPSPAVPPGVPADPLDARFTAIRSALADLRLRVPGVRGGVLAGVDGLVITYDLPPGQEPHDLAALAATTFGLGRQCALVLNQHPFREATLRSERGYFTVYAVDDCSLMAILGGDGLNVARLHIEAQPTTRDLVPMLAELTRGPTA